MNKTFTRKLLIDSIFAGSVVLGALYLKNKYEKNFLKIHKLIDKDTEILNVYTADYVSVADKLENVKDEKDGYISVVYTKNAKKEFELNTLVENVEEEISFDYDFDFDILTEMVEVERAANKEYAQIARFAFELDKVSPNAKMVIHVATREEANRYFALKKEINDIQPLTISIQINKEILDDLFEEE